MKYTQQFIEMATEIMLAARDNVLASEYFHDSMIRPIKIGASHEDRVRTVDHLVLQGSLAINAGKFEVVTGGEPEWLLATAALGFHQAHALAEWLLPNPGMRAKFDQLLTKAIGLRGELAFLDFLISRNPNYVELQHVSLFDDSLGYDITLTTEDGVRHLFEIKTTSRQTLSEFEFYLSRNEYRIAGLEAHWYIACMRISNGEVNFEGLVNWEKLQTTFPNDTSPRNTWASAKVSVQTADLRPYFH